MAVKHQRRIVVEVFICGYQIQLFSPVLIQIFRHQATTPKLSDFVMRDLSFLILVLKAATFSNIISGGFKVWNLAHADHQVDDTNTELFQRISSLEKMAVQVITQEVPNNERMRHEDLNITERFDDEEMDLGILGNVIGQCSECVAKFNAGADDLLMMDICWGIGVDVVKNDDSWIKKTFTDRGQLILVVGNTERFTMKNTIASLQKKYEVFYKKDAKLYKSLTPIY